MPASVLENILANLVTTCAGITTLAGYDFTVASAERFDIDGNSLALAELPKCIVSFLDQDMLVETSRTIEWGANIRVDHYIVHDKTADARTTDEILTERRANLFKALRTDRTRGGYAVDTTVQKMTDFDLISEDGRDTGVIVELYVRFRHALLDPAVNV